MADYKEQARQRTLLDNGNHLCHQCGGEFPPEEFDFYDSRCYECQELAEDDYPDDDDVDLEDDY